MTTDAQQLAECRDALERVVNAVISYDWPDKSALEHARKVLKATRMTQPNDKARELLKRLVEWDANPDAAFRDLPAIVGAARDYLRETEPKHPAEVAWEAATEFSSSCKRAFLAGYKLGTLEAAKLTCAYPDGQRIRQAANQVPE